MSKRFQGVTSTHHANSTSDFAHHTFQLQTNKTGMYSLSLDTWYHRLYPAGALKGLSLIKVSINDTSKDEMVAKTYYYDQWASRSVDLELKEDVLYLVDVTIDWHQKADQNSTASVHRDFSIVAQGPAQVAVEELQVETSSALQNISLSKRVDNWLQNVLKDAGSESGVKVDH